MFKSTTKGKTFTYKKNKIEYPSNTKHKMNYNYQSKETFFMKKLLPIILILVLAVIVMCFVACGNDTNMDNTLTSMSNEMTSIMDDMTTLGEELEEDMTDLSDEMTTTDSILEDGTSTPDISDTTDTSGTTAIAE